MLVVMTRLKCFFYIRFYQSHIWLDTFSTHIEVIVSLYWPFG